MLSPPISQPWDVCVTKLVTCRRCPNASSTDKYLLALQPFWKVDGKAHISPTYMDHESHGEI